MSFESDLYTYLSGYTGLTDLVDDKIYPDHEPQTVAAPYLCFEEVYREKLYSHVGYTTSNIYSIKVSTYAKTKDSALAIALQVATAMDAWPAASTKVGHSFQEGQNGAWQDGLDSYCVDQDYQVFYND